MQFASFIGRLLSKVAAPSRNDVSLSFKRPTGPQVYARSAPGLPNSVAAGCRKKLFIVPRSEHPAFTKKGKRLMQRTKDGRDYQIMDQRGVDWKVWKAAVNDQRRKAAGRWYSGEPQSSIDARKARRA